jgi:hypothetical protein
MDDRIAGSIVSEADESWSLTRGLTTVDGQDPEHLVLDEQVVELERLGFWIESRSENEVVASRRKWYWDCLFTSLTLVVFLKDIDGVLSWSQIEEESEQLLARVREFGVGASERQHRLATLQFYVAPELQYLCEPWRARLWLATSFPAALDRSTGRAYYRRKTPFWGGIYSAKYRFLAARLLEPASAPAREPLSLFGLLLTTIIPAVFVTAVLSAFLR